MKCPKYISDALDAKVRAANLFSKYDYIISEWLEKHTIEVDSCHVWGGVEGLVNPESSATCIRDAIRRKK